MRCPKCGDNGHEGYRVRQIDETPMGDHIDAWFCSECGEQICIEGEDCPPDSFGQYRDEPGGSTKLIWDR